MLNKVSKGFTIIELMITVVVLSVLAALAAPSFLSIIEKRRLVGATDNLASLLQYARSEAIKQNQTIMLQFNAGSWCVGIDDLGADCDCTNPTSCTVNTIQRVLEGNEYDNVTLAVSGFIGTTINFESRQGLPDDNGVFTLDINGQTKTVTLNVIGRVKVD